MDISITYCTSGGYKPKAVSLAAKIKDILGEGPSSSKERAASSTSTSMASWSTRNTKPGNSRTRSPSSRKCRPCSERGAPGGTQQAAAR